MVVAGLKGIAQMQVGYIVTGAIAILIAAYLFAALLWPEKF